MSLVLTPVQDWADRRPFALDGLWVQFHFEWAFSRSKPALMGDAVYDEFESKLARVVFLDAQKEPVATLTPDNEPLAFQAMIKGANDLNVRPTSQVMDQGASPPAQTSTTYEWARFAKGVALEEAFLDALINEDDQALRRLQFERFKMTKSYADRPCEESFFKDLRAEYEQSNRITGMDFVHYYDWLHRSARENLDEEGQLSFACKNTLTQMLSAWATMKEEEVQSWANRNLHVHPRHRALVNAFLTQARTSPDEPTPTGNTEEGALPARPRSRRP